MATGGYLGAENQLIRVQIASVDAAGVPTIVWGYDDATFLYTLSQTAPDNSGHVILTLANAPVDSYHNPVAGQAVELLRDAASLTPDDPSAHSGYIAAAAESVSLSARATTPRRARSRSAATCRPATRTPTSCTCGSGRAR
ncbi:hypothetical protein MAUB1S_02883 [Mycolicibacterium aubagnense]